MGAGKPPDLGELNPDPLQKSYVLLATASPSLSTSYLEESQHFDFWIRQQTFSPPGPSHSLRVSEVQLQALVRE